MARVALSERVLSGEQVELTERQRRVIGVAADLFDRRGYHETSMDEIADATGIRKPTLYHHFQSKSEILFCIHHEIIERLISEQLTHNGLTPSERLRETVRDVIRLVSDRRSFLRVFHQNYRQLPEALRLRVRDRRQYYQALVENVVREGVAAGEFVDMDPTLVTLGILGMGHWANRWYRPEVGPPPDYVADLLFTMVANGIVGPDGARTPPP